MAMIAAARIAAGILCGRNRPRRRVPNKISTARASTESFYMSTRVTYCSIFRTISAQLKR